MRCIEVGASRLWALAVAFIGACVLVGCDKPQPTVVAPAASGAEGASAPAAGSAASATSSTSTPTPGPAASSTTSASGASSSSPGAAAPAASAASASSAGAAGTAAAPAASARGRARSSSPAAVALAPPGPVRDWSEVRLQAARRMVAAQPTRSYLVKSPDPLLAIPVLEVELNGDGSVRRVVVVRYPRQAKDTTQIAIDAVHRGAPYGDVSRLPKPWRFTETFLFDDDRRFKPRVLD